MLQIVRALPTNKCREMIRTLRMEHAIGGSKAPIALMMTMTVTPTDEVDGGGLCINSVI